MDLLTFCLGALALHTVSDMYKNRCKSEEPEKRKKEKRDGN